MDDSADPSHCPDNHCFYLWSVCPLEAIEQKAANPALWQRTREQVKDLWVARHFGVPRVQDMWDHMIGCDYCNPWFEYKAPEPPPKEVHYPRYFMTFTIDRTGRNVPFGKSGKLIYRPPYNGDYETFKALIEEQLSRPAFKGVIYCIEHRETNMHAHALITSEANFSHYEKQWYHMHYNVGNVDQKVVRKDNGIADYMSKEGKFERSEGPNGGYVFNPI